MSDFDYESIEAAVTETVRGRWFLAEYARRQRAADGQQLIEAVNRLEGLVLSGQAALPAPQSSDPSIRLLVERIKEIAGRLEGVAAGMREAGIDTRFWQAVNLQARAVAGLMRTGTASRATLVLPERGTPPAIQAMDAPVPEMLAAPAKLAAPERPEPIDAIAPSAAPLANQPRLNPQTSRVPEIQSTPIGPDARLRAFSGLDDLPLAKKIALFS